MNTLPCESVARRINFEARRLRTGLAHAAGRASVVSRHRRRRASAVRRNVRRARVRNRCTADGSEHLTRHGSRRRCDVRVRGASGGQKIGHRVRKQSANVRKPHLRTRRQRAHATRRAPIRGGTIRAAIVWEVEAVLRRSRARRGRIVMVMNFGRLRGGRWCARPLSQLASRFGHAPRRWHLA